MPNLSKNAVLVIIDMLNIHDSNSVLNRSYYICFSFKEARILAHKALKMELPEIDSLYSFDSHFFRTTSEYILQNSKIRVIINPISEFKNYPFPLN